MMRLAELPEEFERARPILQTIEAAGFEAYFVGGSVRDTLLGQPIHDVDIATSAYPEEIKRLFKRTVDTGIEHGTVMILDHGEGYETTTFRTESTYTDFRRPDAVTFVRSLAEDLKRRDFTINALAMKENGDVIDLFGGLADLQAGLIRAVGQAEERFHEDALRMMRAVRFAAQLNFRIDPSTLAAIGDHAALLSKIAVERIEVEFTKLLLGQRPSQGLVPFMDTGLWQYCPQFANFAPRLQQLAPTLVVSLQTAETAWATICVALGLTQSQVPSLLKAWKLSNHLISVVSRTSHFVQTASAAQVDTWALYTAGRDALHNAGTVMAVLKLGPQHDWVTDYDQFPIHSAKELAVNGHQLMAAGVPKGPELGRSLKQLEQAVVSGRLPNEREPLLAAILSV